jgi:hypothetical protein
MAKMNVMQLMGAKAKLGEFKKEHPEFMQFINETGFGAISEGSTADIKITAANGKETSTSLTLSRSDAEFINSLFSK